MKQLNENQANRYSFVCNALLNIGNCQSTERLNEVREAPRRSLGSLTPVVPSTQADRKNLCVAFVLT